MALANVLTRAQSPEGDFVAIAFSRAFRPTAAHAARAIQFATAINRQPTLPLPALLGAADSESTTSILCYTAPRMMEA